MAGASHSSSSFSTDEVRKIFNKFDKNGDGKISCAEVKDSLGELGVTITLEEVQHYVMQEFDKDGDGYIDLDEFVEFYRHGTLENNDGFLQVLKDAFDLYDHDKNGLISVSELHVVLNRLGMKHTVSECKRMIGQVDEDGDGNVNFEEFKKMMMHKKA